MFGFPTSRHYVIALLHHIVHDNTLFAIVIKHSMLHHIEKQRIQDELDTIDFDKDLVR